MMKRSRMIRIVFATLICLLHLSVSAQRSSERLLTGWEFVKGDLGGIYEALRTGKEASLPVWESVAMPHCYNNFDAVDPDVPYYQGPAWYRNKIDVADRDPHSRLILHFEGSGQKTRLYIGEELIGEHVGGYDEFSFDITDAVQRYLNTGGELSAVPVIVRCDNSRDLEMIPSDLSDFNLYGGLYRYVNLLVVPEQSLNKVHIRPVLSENLKKAELELSTEFYDPAGKEIAGELIYTLYDPAGKEVYTESHTLDGEIKSESTFSIKKPILWDVENPNLYTLKTKLKTRVGEDEIISSFGIRNFEFIPHGPFLLNGERLFLRGTHRHEDHAGLAAAMTEDLIIEEMQLMKEMGVNFIRLGHYQQSRIVLDACDSLGILVWEEIPWCRGGLGGETYREQARRMLRNMISQHYNHPSIIIWGLGNENDWPGDFKTFEKDKIREFMSELNDLSHKLDPDRKTAIRRCDFCADIIDVYSPSIWAGWYRGKYIEYTDVSKEWNDKVDAFLHVEWGASNHACRHSENPDIGLEAIAGGDGADERAGDFLMTGGAARVSKDGDWSETYACNLIDWHLKEQEKMDWHIGTAYWPFKDFSTPLRPENPVPYVNQKGVVQRDFTKKEAFYVFQSYWTEDPMIRIYGHTNPVRWGDAGEKKMVKVYSNCEEVELFLNGKSMGTKIRNSQDFPAAGLRWMLSLKEGENTLVAICSNKKESVRDSITFTYQTKKWSTPDSLTIREISREGDILELEVKVFDMQGVFCPDAKNNIRFELAGDGELLDNLGTSNGSSSIQLYNGRARIKMKLAGQHAIVTASSEGLQTSYIIIEPN